MNIELKFLQKAVENKNYISFTNEKKKYDKVKALKLEYLDNKYYLYTNTNKFEFEKLSKIKVLKERF